MYRKKCIMAKLALRDAFIGHKAMRAPAPVADVAADQRQILRDLAAEYGRQLRQILQVGELIKGSVYQIETRCGNPGCHCATPRGQLHPATVLSWSEAGRTRMRSLGVDQRARVRRLSEQYRRLRHEGPDVVLLDQRELHTVRQLEQPFPLAPPLAALRPRAVRCGAPGPRRCDALP